MGSGYFFGLGIMLDRAGDDCYVPARYGMVAGAHYGVGLLIDQAGNDRYESIGPTYNVAAAWDRTVGLFHDGAGNDHYDLMFSEGLGISQHASWAVAADHSSEDSYKVKSGLGSSGAGSLAVFADMEAPNHFEGFAQLSEFVPADSQILSMQPTGLFISAP